MADLSKKKEVLAEEWIRAQLKRYSTQGLGHLAAELKDSGDFIGMGGILPRDVDGKAEFEIAYSLKPKYWHKRYATEIAQTMKTYAISNIDAERFISIIDKRNVNSAKVARKNDMAVLFETHYLGMNVDVFGFINKHTQ